MEGRPVTKKAGGVHPEPCSTSSEAAPAPSANLSTVRTSARRPSVLWRQDRHSARFPLNSLHVRVICARRGSPTQQISLSTPPRGHEAVEFRLRDASRPLRTSAFLARVHSFSTLSAEMRRSRLPSTSTSNRLNTPVSLSNHSTTSPRSTPLLE
ncbi:hypothetical protein OH77DRAFT_116934 [Trametes cingulata]|nr:hypothetical protein OH77DRAFT_116934 [Trametes cingulata]